MKRLFLLPLLFGVGTVILVIILEGADPVSYLSLSSFLIVTFIPLFVLLMHHNIIDINRYFTSCSSTKKVEMEILKKALYFFNELEKLFIVSGVLGFLCGTISLLQSPSEQKVLSFGFSIAVSCLLYSTGYILFLTIPCKSIIKNKLINGNLKNE